MPTMNKDCLYSTVKNTSGSKMRFGFLPPHGVELASDEEYTVFGNVLEALVRADRGGERRHHTAFAAAIDRGDITIINTPAPVLVNDAGTVKIVILNGSNALAAADPCWSVEDSAGVSDDGEVIPVGRNDRLGVPA